MKLQDTQNNKFRKENTSENELYVLIYANEYFLPNVLTAQIQHMERIRTIVQVGARFDMPFNTKIYMLMRE